MAKVRSAGLVLVLSLLQASAFDLTVLHINDHHSHLSGKDVDLDKSKLGFGDDVKVLYGGYPRLISALSSLQTTAEGNNRGVLKLHAGDAITGTSFYSLFQGEADAKMMLQGCFDAFVLGNHEFDDGDRRLADFIDMFKSGEAGVCPSGTAVLSANVEPGSSSPLNGKLMKSVKLLVKGEEVGVVGITVKKKTEQSSSPDAGTTLSDERTTAQAEIDKLVSEGVNKIILLTHIGHNLDKSWMVGLNGVDAVVGGDSHTLLGDADTASVGFSPVEVYAQELTNGEGKKVCVVQAWEYTKAIGNLEITFDPAGDVLSCGGSPKFAYDADDMVFDNDAKTALNQAEKDAVTTWLDTLGGQWLAVTKDNGTKTVLQTYEDQVESMKTEKLASVPEDLCLERIPGHGGRSTVCSPEDTKANGGAACQLVAKAFLEVTKTADVAIQNAGGCRSDILKGDFTHDDANNVLPFSNTLVTIVLTGAQVKNVLEDALDFAYVDGGSDGAYPYASGIRFAVDASRIKGSRISCLQVNKRLAGGWSSIDDTEEYTVVTNSFIATGHDGYTAFTRGEAENTYTEYSQGFIDYAKDFGTLTKPPIEEWSTQAYTHTDGAVYSTWECPSDDTPTDAAVADAAFTNGSSAADDTPTDAAVADAAFTDGVAVWLLAAVLATFFFL